MVIEYAEVVVIPHSHLHEIMRVYQQVGLNMLKLAAMIFTQLGYTALEFRLVLRSSSWGGINEHRIPYPGREELANRSAKDNQP